MLVSLRQLARLRQNKTEREVSDIRRQNIRCVGNAETASLGFRQIHLVETDAVDGDDLEIGECGADIRRQADMATGDDAADCSTLSERNATLSAASNRR